MKSQNKKPKAKYRVWFGNKFEQTMAVSEKQAINSIKFRLGLSGTYKYHEYKPTKIEILES